MCFAFFSRINQVNMSVVEEGVEQRFGFSVGIDELKGIFCEFLSWQVWGTLSLLCL